jgi:hypothetical protein
MLYLSLILSAFLLATTCGCVWKTEKVATGSQIAWLFAIPGVVCGAAGVVFPIYLLNVVLVASVGVLGGNCGMPRRWFYAWCPAATLVSYALGAWIAMGDLHEADRLSRFQSMANRLAYEKRHQEFDQRGDEMASANAHGADSQQAASLEVSSTGNYWRDYQYRSRVEALKQLHENRILVFINSPGFGIARMLDFKRRAEAPQETLVTLKRMDAIEWWTQGNSNASSSLSLPSSLLSEAQELHRGSLVDFINRPGYGWIKDREHVAGFQAHQFHEFPEWNQKWQLKRVELVSLLSHEEPGVYVTDHLPRMDLLRGVELRSLDEFERTGLPRLEHGEEIVVAQIEKRLRMLGEIRASQECLSCHTAKRGELLGAFSYHFDPAR